MSYVPEPHIHIDGWIEFICSVLFLSIMEVLWKWLRAHLRISFRWERKP